MVMERRAGTRVRVEVTRGDRVESVHEVDVAITAADGDAVARPARPEEAVFVRSAIKPFQALPLLEEGVVDRFDLTDKELALCCASHSGEDRHVAVATSILKKIGLEEGDLACGPHAPFSSAAKAALRSAGREPGPIHNNCSGKHAGMLALARAKGWNLENYQALEHPVQQRILAEVERWTGVDRARIGTGVDGCGVATFALPLGALALAFARLVATARDAASPGGRLVAAMTAHPFLVGGSNRLCTAVMQTTGGRILAKVGAEGVYGAAAVDRQWGIALKVRDGARRAAEVALVEVLSSHGMLEAAEEEELARWRVPVLENTRGEVVGGLRGEVADGE